MISAHLFVGNQLVGDQVPEDNGDEHQTAKYLLTDMEPIS